MSKQGKPNKQGRKINFVTIVLSLALLLLVGLTLSSEFINKSDDAGGSIKKAAAGNNQGEVRFNDNGDLQISKNDITTNATFYPLDIEGTKLEVLAVEAPDGTIRTAFNTCQVCFSSGRGYYEQQDDVLVCQNCGNRFKTSQVEIVRGGCNPIPIFEENKIVTEETIEIPYEFLVESKDIFLNWKNDMQET